MLEGVEVLNRTEIVDMQDWIYPTISIFLGLLLVSYIVFVVGHRIENDIVEICGTGIATICLICFIISGIIGIFIPKHTGEYEYQVTIDDSVSMTEFYEKYEVIDVEGKIYTIKLKEVD